MADRNKYYFQTNPEADRPYPLIASRVLGGSSAPGVKHLSLEGAFQELIDRIHGILENAFCWASFGVELDGALAQQASLSYVEGQIEILARFMPINFLDVVPAGKTKEGLVAQYKKEAADLFAVYGMN